MKTLILLVPLGFPLAGAELDRASPFQDVRWEDSRPVVLVEDEWYHLVSLDGLASSELVAFCKDTYGESWQKRFEEDLVPALRAMGRAPGPTVSLVLEEVESGTRVTRPRVPLSEENRRRLWDARRRREEEVPRVERKHQQEVAPPYRHLARQVPGDPRTDSLRPGAARLAEDLDQLEWLLENTYSYLELRGVDHRAALDAIRQSLRDDTGAATFAIQLMKLLALFGDGHTRVASSARYLDRGYLPFLVLDEKGRHLAVRPDRSGFLDPARPYLRAIDGQPLAKWLEAARLLAPRGAEHLQRRTAQERVLFAGHLRRELGLPAPKELAVEVEAAGGRDRRALKLELAQRLPGAAAWPSRATGKLAGNIGYLRIAEMSDVPADLEALREAMEGFRGTRGLVIDVRENGGGSRQPLRALFPYFMKESDAPRLVNVAACRLPPGVTGGDPRGYLEDRFLHPLSSPLWSQEERALLEKAAAAFKPEWRPKGGRFSDWHFMLLEREKNERLYHYDRPVVVLMNEGCFSATDIFLGAFKGWPRVTLLGAPSGGGSGRALTVELHHSRIGIRLSSMTSYLPGGRLYDGAGVDPDIRADPVATDTIGRTDSLLEQAMSRLRGK